MKKKLLEGLNYMKKRASTLTSISPAFLSQADLLKWSESITKSAATVYDKALDAEYLKSHIGGGDHRLFDGGHDIFSAWQRVKDASPNDSLVQEVTGYISALFKDGTTIKGLPFTTLDKGSFQNWVDWVSDLGIPGLKREYLVDLASFDAFEVLASSLGVVGVIFALKKDDEEKLAEILGSMGIVSIISANPIMGMVVVAGGAYAYAKERKKIDKKGLAQGAGLAAMSAAIFGMLGLPILLELVIVMVVSGLVKKHVFNNNELASMLKQHLTDAPDKMRATISGVVKDLEKKLKKIA